MKKVSLSKADTQMVSVEFEPDWNKETARIEAKFNEAVRQAKDELKRDMAELKRQRDDYEAGKKLES